LQEILQAVRAVEGGAKAGNRDAGRVDRSVGDELTKLRWDRQAVPLTSFV